MEKVSTDMLRSAAPNWSLGSDKQLLDMLQNIHQKIMSKCTETNAKLGDLADSLDTASVDLQNVNNKFMALSNSQFVECRVYDDDIDVAATTTPPKEEQKQSNQSDEIVQMKQCLLVLESMHETIQILDSDSSDDEEERVVLKPKDMYKDRPLPYIIGSQQWKKKWHAGLVVEDSDSDSAGSKWAPGEEYSDSEPEVTDTQTDKQIKDITISSSNASMEASISSQVVKPKPADIAAELARRLGGDVVPPPPTLPDVSEQPKITKVNRPHLPTTATLFPEEPPPLDQCESDRESEDDIFAELHKNRYTHNDAVQKPSIENLFGERSETANKVNNTTNKPIFDDDSEPELFVEKPKEKTLEPQKDDGFKKPIGGISLFGSNKDSNSIGAAILKRNQRKSSSEEENDVEESKVIKPEPKIDEKPNVSSKENQTSKVVKNVPPKNIVEELFVKPKSKKTNISKETNKVVKEKEVTPKKVDLFSDDIFDDIDNIFTSKVVKKPEEKTKPTFDDDLFSEVAVSQKEKTKEVKSIFDSDDDLFSDVTVTKPEKSVAEPKIDNITNTKTVNKTDNLFDTPSFVTPKNTSQLKPGSNVSNDSNKNRKSIFDYDSDDDIFKDRLSNLKTSHIKSDEKSEEKSKSSKTKSIFDDSDDELFAEPRSKPEIPKPASVLKETSVSSTNNQNLEIVDKKKIPEDRSKSIISEESKSKAKETQDSKKNSIFDDDSDEELFGVKNQTSTLNINKETNVEKNPSNIITENIPEVIKETEPSAENRETSSKENLFTSEIAKNQSKSIIIQGSKSNSKETHDSKKNSIFDDDSDEALFGSKNQTSSQNINKQTNSTSNSQNKQDDYPDLSKNDEKIPNNIITENIPEAIKQTEPLAENRKTHSKENIFASEIAKDSENDIFKSTNKNITAPIMTPLNSPSIFDDDEIDDLFSNKTKPPPTDIDEKPIENTQINESTVNEEILSEDGDIFNTQPLPDVPRNIDSNEDDLNSFTAKVNSIEKDSTHENISNNVGDLESVDQDKTPDLSQETTQMVTHTKPDIFSDIFNDMPPEFEKPKEPKKSKNVNALFDDDSDDEASFFKKDEVLPDVTPATYDANERFSIFHDEPPAIDVDFVPKSIKTTKIENENVKEHILDDISKTEVEFKTTHTIIHESNPEKLSSLDESIRSTNAMISDKINRIQTDIQKMDDNSETKHSKNIGKLKPINFNINVNSLLPGASPKKSKPETNEDVDGNTTSSNENQSNNREVKTVNFEDEKESEILNNKISKERAKIQVKRRPSTRRARKEAARKSGIDFGDNIDSTDNSSSIDEPKKRTDNKDSLNSNIEPSEIKTTKESETIKNIKKDVENNVTSVSNNNETPNTGSLETNSEIITKTNKNVTSKVVYILNDEDIFTDTSESIDKPKSETKSDILEPISTLSSTYADKKEAGVDNKTSTHNKETSIDNKISTDKKASIFDSSDSDSELFGAKKKVVPPKAKLFDSDSDDDLFGKSKKNKKVKEKEIKPNTSLFSDGSDEDIFSTKTKKFKDKISPPEEPSTKSSEPVFEDPLSMLTHDN